MILILISDGVLLVITTNCLEQLDSALGTPVDNHISTRPGRLDRILELQPLDEVGRRKLCERILVEWPETWAEVIMTGDGETGAQFQRRCTQKALQLYWTDEQRSNGIDRDFNAAKNLELESR